MFEFIDDREWAYLDGIIDGEGCIIIHGQKSRKGGKVFVYYTLFINVGNTSFSLLKWINDRFGGSVFPQTRLANRRQVWHWNVASKQAEEILLGILPYLVIKKDQAELALRFRDSYKGLKPCSGHPLPASVNEFREKCKVELSDLKKQKTTKRGMPCS